MKYITEIMPQYFIWRNEEESLVKNKIILYYFYMSTWLKSVELYDCFLIKNVDALYDTFMFNFIKFIFSLSNPYVVSI
jgi:hypothetical protein